MKLSLSHEFCDFFYKIRNKARNVLRNLKFEKYVILISDSQNRFYVQAVDHINKSSRKFNKFRRIYDYQEILEHVDYDLGNSYISRIKLNEIEILKFINKFIENDEVGKPRRYVYPDIG